MSRKSLFIKSVDVQAWLVLTGYGGEALDPERKISWYKLLLNSASCGQFQFMFSRLWWAPACFPDDGTYSCTISQNIRRVIQGEVPLPPRKYSQGAPTMILGSREPLSLEIRPITLL
jgi:hypothetical protein